MKIALKVLTALAAVAGTVYVIATYGDKIVAWAKNLLASCPCSKCEEAAVEKVTEEAPVAEQPEAEEAPAEETPAAEPEAEVEIVIEENEPTAEEADFEA